MDLEAVNAEYYGNVRMPLINLDPIVYLGLRYGAANLDPERGPIDYTSTPVFSIILECRVEVSEFDGLARECPALEN